MNVKMLFITVLLCGIILHKTAASSLTAEMPKSEVDMIYSVLAKQDVVIQNLKEETSYLKAKTVSLLEDTHSLRHENAQQTQQILDLQAQLQHRVLKSSEDSKFIYHQYGCDQEIITLSCEPEQGINVTYAIYGMNSEQCSDMCCPPIPSDCSEVVLHNDPLDWLSLKQACDNQTSCSYQYSGAIINN